MIFINFSKFYNDAFILEDLENVNISSKKFEINAEKKQERQN